MLQYVQSSTLMIVPILEILGCLISSVNKVEINAINNASFPPCQSLLHSCDEIVVNFPLSLCRVNFSFMPCCLPKEYGLRHTCSGKVTHTDVSRSETSNSDKMPGEAAAHCFCNEGQSFDIIKL